MRLAFILVLAGACYAPTVPGNVPCDPSSPHCPAGQTCMGIPGAAVCSGSPLSMIDAPSISDAADVDSAIAIDARSDGPVDSAIIMADAKPDAMVIIADAMGVTPDAMGVTPDAQVGPLHVDYPAAVAVCMDPMAPSLTACTQSKGAMQLAVDGQVTTAGTTFAAYLRFDLDGQIAGHMPMAVTLILTDSGVTGSDSDTSGEVWTVGTFTQASLATTAPAQLGTAPIAPAQGPIALNQIVTFALPVGLAGPNQSIFLGMYSTSANGVGYWNNTGTAPPRLHIDTQ